MIVFRLTDRIPVSFGLVTFWLAPFSYEQQQRVQGVTRTQAGMDNVEKLSAAALALKFSLKQVDGLKNADGSVYDLEFGADGLLTDDCVSELLQVGGADKVTVLAMRWALDRIGDPGDLQKSYEERIKALVASGDMKQEVAEAALRNYQLEGLVVDFTQVRNVKKKPSDSSPAS